MANILARVALIAGLSSLLIAALLDFTMLNDIESSTMAVGRLGIHSIETKYLKHSVYMNVYLNFPISCKNVIDTLGIKPFKNREREYTPTCQVVNDSLIQITYSAQVTA